MNEIERKERAKVIFDSLKPGDIIKAQISAFYSGPNLPTIYRFAFITSVVRNPYGVASKKIFVEGFIVGFPEERWADTFDVKRISEHLQREMEFLLL